MKLAFIFLLLMGAAFAQGPQIGNGTTGPPQPPNGFPPCGDANHGIGWTGVFYYCQAIAAVPGPPGATGATGPAGTAPAGLGIVVNSNTISQLACDGVTDDTSKMTALLASIGANPAKLIFPSGQCLLANITFPSNVTLDFSTGGALKALTSSTPTGGAVFVQGNSTEVGAGGNTCSVALANTAAGNTIVFPAMPYPGFSLTFNTPTDTAGNTYTLVQTSLFNQPRNSLAWVASNIAGGSVTITTTATGTLTNNSECMALEFSGLGPIVVADGAGASSNSTGTTMSSGSGTTTAGSLLIGYGGTGIVHPETCTAGAGYTQPAGQAGQTATGLMCAEYKLSSAGGSTSATQTINNNPSPDTWVYSLLALKPGSATIKILGGIVDPDEHQIFYNSTGASGIIDFTGSTTLQTVFPEWWGADPSATAAINTPAIQAAEHGAFGTGRTNASGLSQYNRPLYFSGNYLINDELKFYDVLNFQIGCNGRLSGGLTQTIGNKRIIDGQSIAYGAFKDCTWSATGSSTKPLIDLDYDGVLTAGDLKPQFLDFYHNTFNGNGLVDVGVLIAKSGGAAQGSNIYCYDCAGIGFTGAAWQVGGDNTGRNAGRFYAQNALAIGWYGGDIQGSPLYGFADYGGGYITIYGTSFENGFSTQTGYDFYCEASQGPCDMEHVRSESRKLIAGSTLQVRDSRTINQAVFPNPGGTQPVGTVMRGGAVAGDGAYYQVTNNSSAFVGQGTQAAPTLASGGSSTTIADTNQTILGSLTSGTFTNGETVTQTVTGSSATLLSATVSPSMLITAASGSPDNSHTWVGGTSAAVFTPTAVPASVNWTVNAFNGMFVSVAAGTNALCYGTVASNTASVITIGSWITKYPFTACSAPDSTSTFYLEPNWNHGTVVDGGMTMVYMDEDVIGTCHTCVGFSSSRLEDVFAPGGRINIWGAAAAGNTLKNITASRTDWYRNASDPQAQGMDQDWNVKVYLPSGTSPINWTMPTITGVAYTGSLQQQLGGKVLIFDTGNIGGSPNTSANDVWIGGRSDPKSGNSVSRAILEYGGMLGRATPFGTDQNGADTLIQGGLPTGAGTPGNIDLYLGSTGSTGTTITNGTAQFRISPKGAGFVSGKGQHFFTQAANSDMAGSGASPLTVTFTTAYVSTPICVVMDVSATPAIVAMSAYSNTGFTATGTAGHTLNYVCVGNPN